MTAHNPFTDDELATLKRLRAEGVSGRSIAEKLGRPVTTIEFQVKRNKIPLPPRPSLDIPPDFARRWQTTSLYDLGKHYGHSKEWAGRVAKQLGLKRPVGHNLPNFKEPKPGKPNPFMTTARMPISTAVMTEAGRAAEYLKSLAPTYRCDEQKRPQQDGRLWRHGTLTLDDKQIIERAAEVKARRARMRGVAA